MQVRLRGAVAVLAAVLVLLGALGGCAAGPATTLQQSRLAADLARLRGDDGLYSASVPDRPGLYDSAYGLAALSALGEPGQLSEPVTRKVFADQITGDQLWGRLYLALLEQTLHLRLHDTSDVAALRAMHTPRGDFADPAAQHTRVPDRGAELAATTAALRALKTFGAPLTGNAATTTRRWLDTDGTRAAATSLTQRLHLVQARAALGLPAPAALRNTLRTWWSRTGANQHGPVSGDAFLETCSYIRLARIADVELSGRRDQLLANLDPSPLPVGDPQIADALTESLTVLHAKPARSAALRRYLWTRRLPSGLFSAVQQRDGDLEASFQVEALRTLTGLPTQDPQLAAALRAHRGTVQRSGQGAQAVWLAVLEAAGGSVGTPDRRTLTAQAVKDVPPLSAGTAQQWSEVSAALRSSHLRVPRVDITPWPADTAEHRYATYLAVSGLEKDGRLAELPNTPSSDALARQGMELLRTGSLHQAEAALSAAHATGWHPTAAQRTLMADRLTSLQGCPGTPSLFRDSASSQACDVYATLSAWRIFALLGTVPRQ
ncbi:MULTISPECIES: hypothetical protein [unclassified Streptomyces]|uniref:hypothetical protein n=1 Tax=unclassified Streptomyces TaxID=2593676 RepID=UPI0022599B26|nr:MULTISPECIES: hypothetical protein [unclassified Streptomyces]MCX5063870.1 hypothetical protein [Streptomyces sp. NBC_00452]